MIAEGIATAATMREATGLATVAAFNSGNLELVARAFRKRAPAGSTIIAATITTICRVERAHCPTSDRRRPPQRHRPSPTFAPTDKGTDWNDYAAQHGTAAARSIAEVELRSNGIALAPRPVSRPITQADRDAMRQKMTAFPKGGPSTAFKAAVEASSRAQQVSQTLRPKL